jgi:small subunit ribosomal protein S7e
MASKIVKIAGAKPVDEFEITIGQAVIDLENSVPELKKDLRPLNITGAKEVSMQLCVCVCIRHST